MNFPYRWRWWKIHSSNLFSLSAFVMTETELNVMAALAMTGLKNKPKKE